MQIIRIMPLLPEPQVALRRRERNRLVTPLGLGKLLHRRADLLPTCIAPADTPALVQTSTMTTPSLLRTKVSASFLFPACCVCSCYFSL